MRSRRLITLCVLLWIHTLHAANVDRSDGVPADFPKDIPIYKNATFKSYRPIVPSNPNLGNVLSLETSDSKGTVLAFYNNALPANGWAVGTISGAPDSLVASKDDRRISVNVSESAGAKRITLIQLGVNQGK